MAAKFAAAENIPNLLLLEVRHLGVPVLVPDPVDLLLQLLHLQQVRDKPLIPNVRVISKLFLSTYLALRQLVPRQLVLLFKMATCPHDT